MKNVQNVLVRFTTNVFNWLVFITMTLTVVTVFVQIFFRYIINSPLIWSEELAKFMFPWLVLSGAALAFKANSHIKIDYFADRFPKRLRSAMDRIVPILSFVFFVLVIFYTIPLAESQKDVKSPVLHIPLNYFSLSIVIGFVGMIIYICKKKREE